MKPPGMENLGGWGLKLETTLCGGVWIFSGTTQFQEGAWHLVNGFSSVRFHHIVSLAVPQRLKVEGDLKPSFSGLLKLAFQNFDYFLHLRFLLAAESFLSH